MTNKKFKNANKNFILSEILNANYSNLATVLICLHKHFGYGYKRLCRWFNDYADSMVVTFAEYDRLGVQHEKIQQHLHRIKVPYDYFLSITVKRCSAKIRTPNVIESLADNLALSAIQTNDICGFGKERLMRLYDYVCDYQGDSVKELEKLGIQIKDDNYPDIDDVRYRKPKISYTEAVKATKAVDRMKEFLNQ